MMGTASFGSHGSGSGLRSGGGGAGSALSSDGQMGSTPYDKAIIEDEVKGRFKELFARANPYLRSMVYNSYLANMFTELFDFSALLRGEHPTVIIGTKYGIDMDEPMFINTLISKLDEKFRTKEAEPRAIEAARITLEQVLYRAVKDDAYLSIEGNGNEVVEAMRMNTAFWRSLSGHVLANLAINIYKLGTETKIAMATRATVKEIEQRTNQVIASFKAADGNQKPEYRQLFEYIDQNWNWFKEVMTK